VIRTGLDRLLATPEKLHGRRYGLLAHGAAVSRELVPIHLALSRFCATPPARLFAPEHGFYGIEQDMVPAAGGADPWTGVEVASLYEHDEQSLRPQPHAFEGLDLLIIDVQDIGARYYTYAASAVWAAEAALRAGCEVWVLDRPNPLGGERIEGNLPQVGFESFVGAFRVPVVHGLTVGELVRLEAMRRRWERNVEVWPLDGWRRSMLWEETGLQWIAPSPNMPTPSIARIYPGLCLLEATALSEGRGTTRPFQLFGAPDVNPVELVERLTAIRLRGARFVPTYFRPQFQKHRGEVCGGAEMFVTDASEFAAYRSGIEILAVLASLGSDVLVWRDQPYEFVADRPAIDLLTGSEVCREALEALRRDGNRTRLDAWLATWSADEAEFRRDRRSSLLYPEAA
jgi:uncharacterized protein YbbC (DUF1343 family)